MIKKNGNNEEQKTRTPYTFYLEMSSLMYLY